MKKSFVWWLSGVIIVLGIAGYFIWKINYPATVQTIVPMSLATTTPSGWNTYSNAQLGFSFMYPRTWQVSEKTDTKGNPYIDLSSGMYLEPQLPTVPTEEIDFSVVNKNYFDPSIGTKVGMIGYDSTNNQLIDTSESSNCFSSPFLQIVGAPMTFLYDGSLMSTPAHENYALTTQNGNIILVTEFSLSEPDQSIDSKIATSFSLLNGNTLVAPSCVQTQ